MPAVVGSERHRAGVERLRAPYATIYDDPVASADLYGTGELDRLRAEADPQGRLSTLYEKAVGAR